MQFSASAVVWIDFVCDLLVSDLSIERVDAKSSSPAGPAELFVTGSEITFLYVSVKIVTTLM
jgi:hypothetical protein